jgi:hypothetical protein
MKRSSTSPRPSPIEKRHKPDPQQVAINEKITEIAHRQHWQNQFDKAGNDSEWRDFFPAVIVAITNRKISAILPQSEDDSIKITNSLSENELKEWKDGVRKGLKDGDWTDLINHREFPITSKDWTAMNYCDNETPSRNNQPWHFRFLFHFYRPNGKLTLSFSFQATLSYLPDIF